MAAKKRGLGRGLDALLGASASAESQNDARQTMQDAKTSLPRELPVDLVQRGKYQPRRDMEPESLQELADSIKAQGVMQPILVRAISDKKIRNYCR